MNVVSTNGEASVGGIVGWNYVNDSEKGQTIACYADGCTTDSEDGKGKLTDAANVVGENATDCVITQCYYITYGTNTLSGHDTDTSNTTATVWDGDGGAMKLMNGAIDITDLPTAVVKYYWNGTYDAPTFSTTKP